MGHEEEEPGSWHLKPGTWHLRFEPADLDVLEIRKSSTFLNNVFSC